MSDSPSASLRLLIVDDSALYRQAIAAALHDLDGIEIVGIAKDGQDAIEKIQRLSPDVLTLDVEMPVMNGIETLREMNRLRLTARAIMVSSLTREGARVTLDALFEGAFDFIAKPTGGLHETRATLRAALIEKIAAFQIHRAEGSQVQNAVAAPRPNARQAPRQTPSANLNGCQMVVIGTSTGGPKALNFVLPRFDPGFPVPIVVVQHMPPDYTGMMARRMDEVCQLPVVEVVDGQAIVPGTIYLAPGGRHLKIASSLKSDSFVAKLTDDAPENSCRPAVDYTLRSATEVCGGDILAVIMTGMGKDGRKSCEQAKNLGGTVFTQDAPTSAVYGMPKAVVDAGLSDRELPLGKIAAAITRHVYRHHRSHSIAKDQS